MTLPCWWSGFYAAVCLESHSVPSTLFKLIREHIHTKHPPVTHSTEQVVYLQAHLRTLHTCANLFWSLQPKLVSYLQQWHHTRQQWDVTPPSHPAYPSPALPHPNSSIHTAPAQQNLPTWIETQLDIWNYFITSLSVDAQLWFSRSPENSDHTYRLVERFQQVVYSVMGKLLLPLYTTTLTPRITPAPMAATHPGSIPSLWQSEPQDHSNSTNQHSGTYSPPYASVYTPPALTGPPMNPVASYHTSTPRTARTEPRGLRIPKIMTRPRAPTSMDYPETSHAAPLHHPTVRRDTEVQSPPDTYSDSE